MSSTPDCIWIVDDEPEIREVLEAVLRKEGFVPRLFSSPGEVLPAMSRELPDLIVLDVVMPEMNGLDLCRTIKADPRTSKIPIIFLTGQGEENDVLEGFELGADDYVTKPFSLKLLAARIRSVLRRYREVSGAAVLQEKPQQLSYGPFTLDRERHEVKVSGQPVALTLAEYRLLEALLTDAGRVFTRKDLLIAIAGHDKTLVERNVDVHVGTMRRKLGEAGAWVITVRGIGYKLRA